MHAKSAPRAFTALYPNLTSLPPFSPPEALLTDVETFSPSLDYTLQLFLRPSQYRNISTSISPSYAPSTTPPDALEIERQATRSGSYRALIFATGAHFSARHFNLPFKPEGGPNAQIEFFDLALRELLNRFARALESATEEERSGKEVVVRPTTMGHDDCHDAEGPLAEEDEKKSSWWSWPDMWRMNEHGAVSLALPAPRLRPIHATTAQLTLLDAQNIVRDFNHPLITWLDISRPTNLRPDAVRPVPSRLSPLMFSLTDGWHTAHQRRLPSPQRRNRRRRRLDALYGLLAAREGGLARPGAMNGALAVEETRNWGDAVFRVCSEALLAFLHLHRCDPDLRNPLWRLSSLATSFSLGVSLTAGCARFGGDRQCEMNGREKGS